MSLQKWPTEKIFGPNDLQKTAKKANGQPTGNTAKFLKVGHKTVNLTILIVSLRFTRVHSFAWPNFGTNFSSVGLYCITISWQQIFKGSLQVTIAGFCRMLVWNTGAAPSDFQTGLVISDFSMQSSDFFAKYVFEENRLSFF